MLHNFKAAVVKEIGMRILRLFLGLSCFSVGGLLAGNSLVVAQDDIVRQGDLREVDHAVPGTWEHVDELADDLEKYAQDLHDEVHLHLEGHEYFRHMDAHAEEIEELAEHIHELAHKGKSIKHLREDVVELDEQVHHADGVITKIARRGVRSEHYDGAVRQTRRIVKSMNAILHHLEEDLAELDPDYRRGHRHQTLRPGLDDHGSRYRPSEEYHRPRIYREPRHDHDWHHRYDDHYRH